MHDKVRREIANKGVARSHIIILEALLRLRQVCCDPRLVKNRPEARNAQSAKLSRLMEMLPELIEEGRRILLFSQFTSMLELIEGGLREREIDFVKLVGNTRDRASVVRKFQSGSVPLFLISLKAGGTGLNLTAADTVIHYDPWWNPSVEAQATDRAHRAGQAGFRLQAPYVGHGGGKNPRVAGSQAGADGGRREDQRHGATVRGGRGRAFGAAVLTRRGGDGRMAAAHPRYPSAEGRPAMRRTAR